MRSVSIITVNFNQHQVNIDFLNSIKQNPSIYPLEIVFVDNGSVEEFEPIYKEIFPDLVYVRSAVNLGFAGGNNLGIKAATGDFLLLLNNDTEITAHLIDNLVDEMERNPTVGLISPLILFHDEPKVIQYAGYTPMDYLTARNNGIGNMEVDQNQYFNDSRATAYCHGAAMMCTRVALNQAGLMTENYFLYYEELDWCEKFKRAGFQIWFLGKAKIYHKESMSVGRESVIKTYFMTRNRMLFIRRNTSLLNTFLFYVYYVLFACNKQIILYLIKGRLDLAKWTLKGVLWNFTHKKNSTNLGFKI